MSNFLKKPDAIDYGYTPNAYNAKNYEPSNILNHPDNNFGKRSIEIDQHLVFSVPATTFQMGSNTPYYWPPTENVPPAYKIRIILWQLMSRVAERAMMQNFNQSTDNDDSDNDENGQLNENENFGAAFPLCAFETGNVNGRLRINHLQHTTLPRNFNNLPRNEQNAIWENNGRFPIVSRQEYQERARTWVLAQNNNSEDQRGGECHVLLEFFRGANDPRHCSGYRIWILKESGSTVDLNKCMGEVIASATAKPTNGKKIKPSYNNWWRQVKNNTDLKHFSGNALYLNQNHFSGNANSLPLHEQQNPVHPTNVFSVGGWRSIIYGLDRDNNGKNWLPKLYPNLDIDSERFKVENYFQRDDFKKFILPDGNKSFRNSFYKCTLADLNQDNFMNKYRLDQFCDNILPMLRDTYSQIGEPRATSALTEGGDIDAAVVATDPAFKKRKIQPQIENQYSGGSLDVCGPAGRKKRDRGLVFIQGEDDAFLIARAMTAQYVGPEGIRALENAKCNQDTYYIRLKGLKKCMVMVRSIFEGNGNANVSDGLYGIINTELKLKKSGFTERFMNIQHVGHNFHDDFVAFIFWGAEYHLCISTLHYDLYNTMMNVGCAYFMDKTKNHLIKEGKHGSGKSNNIFNVETVKCDGVVQTLTNASMLAHFFAGHETFKIEANHEPDPTTMGGKGTSSNPQIQQKTEQKKSKLAECQGSRWTTVWNPETNRYETVKTITVWSSVNIQAQNGGSINPALLNRFQTNAVPIKTRDVKDINYQKSAQNEMDEHQVAEKNMFINKCKRIDSNLAKVSAMFDLVGGLTAVDMQAFNDVYDYMKNRGALANNDARSVNRCVNTAKTQVIYDAIAILFYYKPTLTCATVGKWGDVDCERKVLNHYIGGIKIRDNDLLQKISYLFDDENKSHKLNTKVYHEFHRDNDTFNFEGIGNAVKCKIDLTNNQIYSIDEDNKEVLESVELYSIWEHKDLYDWKSNYKKGDEMVFYFYGEQTNNRSYFIRFQLLEDHWVHDEVDTIQEFFKMKDIIETRAKEREVDVQYLSYDDMKYILQLFQKDVPLRAVELRNSFNMMYANANVCCEQFLTQWKIVQKNGKDKRIESLLGKYKGQMITYNLSEKDRSVEKWRDLDLLMYCTVDIAVRTFCTMRDEFVPAYQDKMKMAIANIAKKKLSMFKSSQPVKYFYPINDMPNPGINDVDLNYISLSQKSQFTIEIQEGLKDILTPGLETHTDSFMIDRMLASLDKQLVKVYYEELKTVVHIENTEEGLRWKHYIPSPHGGNGTIADWNGNTARNTSHKAQIIKFKKGCFYVHVAWVYEILDTQNTNNRLKDAYISALSSYEYPIPEDIDSEERRIEKAISELDESLSEEERQKKVKSIERKEKKRKKKDKVLQKKSIKILTGSSWIGEVLKPTEEDCTKEALQSNKKVDVVTYCCPAVSSSIEVHGNTKLNKSVKKKNSHHRYSKFMSGMKRKRTTQRRDVIKMSFDRHISCQRAKKLNEHNLSLENMDLYEQFKYLSKEDMLNDLKLAQSNDLGDLFNYPNSYVASEYLHEHIRSRVEEQYLLKEKFKAICLGARDRFRIRLWRKMQEKFQDDEDKMQIINDYISSDWWRNWNEGKFLQFLSTLQETTQQKEQNFEINWNRDKQLDKQVIKTCIASWGAVSKFI